MSDNLNYLKGFNSSMKKWDSFLLEEMSSLQKCCHHTPTFLQRYETRLLIPSRLSDNEFLLMCILINKLPEYSFFKIDLRSETWKRFYRPDLLYCLDQTEWSIRLSTESDNISGILRQKRVNREVRENFPNTTHCVGARVGYPNGRKFRTFLYCYLLTDEEEGALERFLFLVHSQKQENWLYGNILNRNKLKKKSLFRFRQKDQSPARKPQRKRGYDDKGTLRDPTVSPIEAAPFAKEELKELSEIRKSTLEYLDILRSKLNVGVGYSKQS